MAREMKIRSEETWRRVREAWEAGETAGSAARRFDVGFSNLQRRRIQEGWSRAHLIPAEPDPEPEDGGLAAVASEAARGASPEVALEPGAAIAQGKARAAALIAQGRGTEARALLMAIEAMERAAPPEAETAEAPGGGLNGQGLRGEALKDAGMRALLITLERDAVIRSLATTVAHAMLAKPETAPVGQLPYVYHWRARNLGPEVAERDRAAEAAGGYGETFWDEEGRMRDLLDMDLALIDQTRRMWRAMWNLPVEDGPWEELEAGDG